MEIKLFVAVKAFLVFNQKILILRESTYYSEGTNAGKFDVVGGRITPGERFEDAILREIKEETGLNATIGTPFFMSEWRPQVKGEQWQIVATFLECFTDTDEVRLSNDHVSYEWIDPKEYKKFPLIENIRSAFETYLKLH